MGPITRAIAALVARLSQTESRPTPTAAVAMIGCGTLCVISSLYLAWMSSSSSPINQVKNQMQDMMKSVNATGMNVNFTMPGDALGGGSGFGPMVLTILVFALGVATDRAGRLGHVARRPGLSRRQSPPPMRRACKRVTVVPASPSGSRRSAASPGATGGQLWG